MKFQDERLVLICAFRYALGRRTYVSHSLVEEILANWDELPDHDKQLFKREIEEERRVNGKCGMEMDDQQWQRIIDK